MSYEQAMKHSKNHRKDPFCQQCSGYFGKPLKELQAEENHSLSYTVKTAYEETVLSATSYDEILQKAQCLKSKDSLFLYSSEIGIMGRLDLYYKGENK